MALTIRSKGVAMHSHDRTLLSSLGFADADKADSRHDLACQYLAEWDNHEKIAKAVGKRDSFIFVSAEDHLDHCLKTTHPEEMLGRDILAMGRDEQVRAMCELYGSPRFESIVSKGEGQYRTTVGFIDLILPFYKKQTRNVRYQHYPISKDCVVADFRRSAILVEVKVNPVGVGDLMRQVGLYNQHASSVVSSGVAIHWAVATAFPMSVGDLAVLRSNNIHHIRLGEAFDRWVEVRRSEPPANSPETSIVF